MTNLLFCGIVGVTIGFLYRDLRDSIKELKDKLPKEKPDLGVTPASYGTVKGYSDQNSEIGLVETKTPEQLAWQADEKLRQEQFGVKK